MKTTIAALFALSVSAVSLTSSIASAKETDHRGEMVVKGQTAKVFAAGPATIHLYSMDRGGKYFAAPAVTGTDADCIEIQKTAQDQQLSIQVDRRNVLEIGVGEVACVATTSPRNFELLWHVRPAVSPANQAVAQAR